MYSTIKGYITRLSATRESLHARDSTYSPLFVITLLILFPPLLLYSYRTTLGMHFHSDTSLDDFTMSFTEVFENIFGRLSLLTK